jgi:hypothetical protein
MSDNELLNQIGVRTACPMDWNRMHGDDRIRYCDSCGKQVHDLAAMSAAEVSALSGNRTGATCVRLSRHPDGTLVTLDCPIQVLPAPRRWQFNIRTFMAVIAAFAALFGLGRLLASSQPPWPRPPAPPPTPGAVTTIMGDMY